MINKILSIIDYLLRFPYQFLFLLKLLMKGSLIVLPFRGNARILFHSTNVEIGKNVFIGRGSWLSVKQGARFKVGDNSVLNGFISISCTSSIEIGRNVLFAERVFIGDADHGFEDVNIPIKDQTTTQPFPVKIEDDCWIGVNVCILKNITIGKHSIIGAGSVVTKSVPPYSIAVGNPARVIKKYDFDRKEWIAVK